MRPVSAVLGLGIASLWITACSHQAAPAATAPATSPAAAAPAPATTAPANQPVPPASAPAATSAASMTGSSAIDLTGRWAGTADVGGQTIPVNVNLTRGPNGNYTGDAAPEGQQGAALTAFRIEGNKVYMTFAAPDGEAVFDVTLSADRLAMQGNVQYNGQSIAFTARKRQ